MKGDSQPRIFMSVINDLSGDQRIHRIAQTLEANGYRVRVLGRILPHSKPLPDMNYEVHRMKLFLTRGKGFYLEYNLRLFFYLLFRPVDILHANDLDTLLANFLVARLRRKKIVYDTHEYFTQVPELLDRPWTQWIWQQLEGFIFPRLKHIFTVNQSIADIYSQKYGIEVGVVRNLPLRINSPQKHSNPDSKILLYQGALNMGRGIELMIQAMAYLPQFTLWIVGRGDIEEELKALTSTQSYPERVKFVGFIPFEKLDEITSHAVLGFSLEEDKGMNYRYASPNKIYDYIQAGVPVLASDLPEMKRIVKHYKVGEVLKTVRRTPRALASQVLAMTKDLPAYKQYQLSCQEAAKVLNWESEQHRLLEIYGKLG